MKILLIGKTGQLGGSILECASGVHEVLAPGRDELDIERPGTVRRAVASFKPEAIVNTAAFHNVPVCEDEPFKAMRVNFLAIRDLAAIARDSGIRFMTFSSDYVFDGLSKKPYKEDDHTAPLQNYGLSKLAGEYAALGVWPGRTQVVRTCGLYGMFGAKSKGGNFVDKRIWEAEASRTLEMGSDQVVTPTFTDDLGRASIELLTHREAGPGIYHLSNAGHCNWYEFTCAIYELMGLDVKVKPVDRGGMGGGVLKPLYSVLDNSKANALGIEMPHWRDALSRYLRAKHLG